MAFIYKCCKMHEIQEPKCCASSINRIPLKMHLNVVITQMYGTKFSLILFAGAKTSETWRQSGTLKGSSSTQ